MIFTEVDFEQIDELVFRKLFVGMTQAGLKLVPVFSERAAEFSCAYLNMPQGLSRPLISHVPPRSRFRRPMPLPSVPKTDSTVE